jgi:hypothetical protein
MLSVAAWRKDRESRSEVRLLPLESVTVTVTLR